MKILLVEDEEDLREALIRILQLKQNVEIHGLDSGNAAIAKLKAGESYQLIISDYAKWLWRRSSKVSRGI